MACAVNCALCLDQAPFHAVWINKAHQLNRWKLLVLVSRGSHPLNPGLQALMRWEYGPTKTLIKTMACQVRRSCLKLQATHSIDKVAVSYLALLTSAHERIGV